MKESKRFIQQKDIVTETVGKGVTRQILGYNNEVMLVKVSFEKGSIGDIHSHAHVQTSYVESGRFEVIIDNEKLILEKGDGFLAPSHVPHGVICLEAGVLIDTFAPVREDFLK